MHWSWRAAKADPTPEAFAAHLERMRALERDTLKLVQAGAAAERDRLRARYHVLEAELAVERMRQTAKQK